MGLFAFQFSQSLSASSDNNIFVAFYRGKIISGTSHGMVTTASSTVAGAFEATDGSGA